MLDVVSEHRTDLGASGRLTAGRQEADHEIDQEDKGNVHEPLDLGRFRDQGSVDEGGELVAVKDVGSDPGGTLDQPDVWTMVDVREARRGLGDMVDDGLVDGHGRERNAPLFDQVGE